MTPVVRARARAACRSHPLVAGRSRNQAPAPQTEIAGQRMKEAAHE